EVEINRLKERVKNIEDQEGVIGDKSGDDAPIKGRSPNEGEAPAERISNDSEEIARVLTSMDAVTVLAGENNVPTGSGFIPTAGPPATIVSTGSEVGPTASPIVRKRKEKEVMRIRRETREREDIRMNEQIARDADVARIHAEEEIQGMIDSLDKSNETRKPMSKKQKREYYMAVIKSYLGWRFKDFKEEAPESKTPTEEVSEDKIKEMMQLVPVEDVYVQALQVKHPIIDWKVHSEGERNYWQIIRLGGSTACYQFFVDLLRQLDRDDLNQLWALVKEYLSIRPSSNDKEMEL
nr:hypothetical protein [Tanacetum cinerariifolium]